MPGGPGAGAISSLGIACGRNRFLRIDNKLENLGKRERERERERERTGDLEQAPKMVDFRLRC